MRYRLETTFGKRSSAQFLSFHDRKMNSRRRKSQSRIETIKGRKAQNGRGGRRELDDPVTQVSAFCGAEEVESGGLQKQKAQQYISQISQSPSPPLGKLKKSHSKSSSKQNVQKQTIQKKDDAHKTQQENEAKEDIQKLPEPFDAEIQNEIQPSVLSANQQAHSSSTACINMERITAFLQELDKQTQCTTTLPKFARFTSKRAARFELPVNLRMLSSLTPMDYLRKYCMVTPTKEQSSQRFFHKHCKLHIEDVLKAQFLEAALVDSFGRKLTNDEMEMLRGYVGWNADELLEERDFVVISAFLERMLCVLDREVRNDQTRTLDQKDELEMADFSCLQDKLQDIEISPELLRLLLFIKNS